MIVVVVKNVLYFFERILIEISIPMTKAKEKIVVSRCDRSKICIGFT